MASRGQRRILLVGAQTLVLQALRHCLESALGVEGCVSDAAGLPEAVRSGPDAVVMQLTTSPGEGLDQLRRLRDALPDAAVVVLAEDGDPALAAEAFRLGVHGWVLESSTVPDLVDAVRAALTGRRHLTALVAGGDIEALHELVLEGPRERIRPRERQVLRLLAQGKVMREIGHELGISTRTVAFHKYRMMESLGVRSTAELLQFAIRKDMIGLRVDG